MTSLLAGHRGGHQGGEADDLSTEFLGGGDERFTVDVGADVLHVKPPTVSMVATISLPTACVTLDGADDDFRLFLEGTSIDGLHELGFRAT